MEQIPNIFSLYKEKQSRDQQKHDIYTIVLNKCIEKIVYTNRHTDKTFVIFEVPKILIGYPHYDMKSCILFIMEKLSEKHYLVEFTEPFYLYIDWGTALQNQSKQNVKSKSSSIPSKLKKQTQRLLAKFPDASKVEFIYEDTLSDSKSKEKANKKKR
jgi:hypothetical protein